MRYLQVLLFFFLCQNNFAQYITIDESLTPQQLVENVLINNGCASISNVTATGANFATGEKSLGYFNRGSSNFVFQDGIILSTGKVSSAPGPTPPLADSGSGMVWVGDNDLNTILNINSINASVLEFDFVPLGNTISFQYIFASEEYEANTDYPCRFSDAFAFLLKPIGAPNYQNLAIIPNTNIPVKVTTVHPLITANNGCPAQNAQYFDQFNGIQYPTVYGGQTVVLTAQSAVIPGTPYHIKLVIADERDARYDSAIFLKGGSFNLGVDFGDNRTFTNANPVCFNEPVVLDATLPNVVSYQWYFNNVAIPGEINPTLTINPPYTALQNGIYSVDQFYNINCIPRSNITLEFAEPLPIGITEFTECDAVEPQDGIHAFNLTNLIPSIYPTLPTGYQVGFFNATTSTTQLPLNYTNTTPYQQIIYARVLNTQGCYQDIPVTLNVNTFDEFVEDETVYFCNGNTIELDAGSGFISYSWNTVPVQNTQTITVTVGDEYIVTLENATNCFKDKTFNVIESDIASINDIEIVDLSNNNSATVIATGDGDYEYSIDGINFQESKIFENLSFGEYIAYVRDKNGCGIVSREFYIIDYLKFFTPNGDSYNDTWNISNLEKKGLENSKIYIFDRYGKLLKQISPDGFGWDGTFNGKELPSQDFWFILELSNGETVKNHFSLKR
ncbi:MAG: T9SS type B sorting domain-containing protein [Flavobacterium sp.]|nr:T9SS type B sorting domain-containing protein [Flavobacterium sp.]